MGFTGHAKYLSKWLINARSVCSVSRFCGLHLRPQIAYAEKFYIIIHQHIDDSPAGHWLNER